MTSLTYISLLLLAVTPQLSAIELSKLGQFRLFGLESLSITCNFTYEPYGAALNTAEEGMILIGATRLWRHILLAKPRPDGLPRGFVEFTLLGWGEDRARVVLLDTLFMIGFANRTDHYFVLKPYAHLMPGATVLNFGDPYFLGPNLSLPDLALGQTPFLEAAGALGVHADGAPDAGIQLAMATLVVMIPESLRLVPIRAKMEEFWESGTTGYLTDKKYLYYILSWGSISRLLLCSAGGYELRGNAGSHLRDTVGISTREQALDIVNIILWPTVFDQNNVYRSCGDMMPNPNRQRRRRHRRVQGPT